MNSREYDKLLIKYNTPEKFKEFVDYRENEKKRVEKEYDLNVTILLITMYITMIFIAFLIDHYRG